MPVPSLITDLSTTAGSNSPSGSDNVFPSLDDYLRSLSAFIASIRDNSGNGWTSPYLPLTYSAGTANGVVYLNGSKVVTSGTALAFNGTSLLVGKNSSDANNWGVQNYATNAFGSGVQLTYGGVGSAGLWVPAASSLAFGADAGSGTTEQMRLNSTGLGIGTSPSNRLDVFGSGSYSAAVDMPTAQLRLKHTIFPVQLYAGLDHVDRFAYLQASETGVGYRNISLQPAGGNVGIGTSSPAARLHVVGPTFRHNDATGSYGYTITAASSKTVTAALFGGGYFAWQTNASGSDAMTLDASNRLLVGTTTVGTTAAGAGFTLFESTQAEIRLQTTSSGTGTTNGLQLALSGVDAYLWNIENGPMLFGTNGNERARITSGGEFVVNDTNAVASATLSSVSNGSNAAAGFKSNSSTVYAIVNIWGNETSGNQIFARFATDSNSERGTISYNRAGGLVAYNTTSDYRAKDIIGPVQNPGATIDALKVYEGVMKGATQSRPMLIAHEAQAVAPYAVSGVKDEMNEDGTPKFQQMDVSSLVPLLLAEIQSLRARVAALEAA